MFSSQENIYNNQLNCQQKRCKFTCIASVKIIPPMFKRRKYFTIIKLNCQQKPLLIYLYSQCKIMPPIFESQENFPKINSIVGKNLINFLVQPGLSNTTDVQQSGKSFTRINRTLVIHLYSRCKNHTTDVQKKEILYNNKT